MACFKSFLTLVVFLLAGGHKVLAAPLPHSADINMPPEVNHMTQDMPPPTDSAAATPSTSTSSSTTTTSYENEETNILSGNTIDRVGNVVGNLNGNTVPVLSGNTLGDISLDVLKRDASLLASARRQAMRARRYAKRWEA